MTKALLILLLLCSQVLGASQVIVYVDTGASGGADGTSWTDAYTDVETAISTEEKDISAATGSDEQYTFLLRASTSAWDTSVLLVGAAWAARGDNFVEFVGNPIVTLGVWDASTYVLHNNNSRVAAAAVTNADARFRNLQIKVTENTWSSTKYGIQGLVNCRVNIDSCILWGEELYNAEINLIKVESWEWNIRNTTMFFTDEGANAPNNNKGIYGTGTISIYNCVVWKAFQGIYPWSGTWKCYNTISAKNVNTDFVTTAAGFSTLDYCASDDGTGTNAVTPSGLTWANEMADPNGMDFTLIAGGNCEEGGIDDPNSGGYSDDITGTARSSPWDIGAYEVEGGISGQVMIISKDFWGKFLQEGINGKWKFGKVA